MWNRLSPHMRAVLQALFVTFLWATSWVLIKIGLEDIPALTFAGLRYSLAFLCLLPLALYSGRLAPLRKLSWGDWLRLVALGLLFYTVTQGAQFIGLAILPAVTVNLVLNFTTVVVALLGIGFLAERPGAMQWAGMALALLGAVIYFFPVMLPRGQIIGLIVVFGGVLANAGSAILGRYLNKRGDLPPLTITVASMGLGSLVLLGSGATMQGLPPLSLAGWAIVAWLAVVNTALAFTLWNHTLRVLSAVESSIINSTMIVQIPILAWLFLGERLSPQEAVGLALAGTGALLVQWRRAPQQRPMQAEPSQWGARAGLEE